MINFERSNNGLGAINLCFMAGKNSQLGYTNGISCLTSQILLNGSKNYKKHQLIYKPNQYGGAINIGVSDTFTCINARCLDSNIENMVELLYSMIFESEFNDLEKQKRITREVNTNTMNDPFKILLDRLYQNTVDRKFGSLYLTDDFNDITLNEVKRFHKEKYVNPSVAIMSSNNKVIDLVHSLTCKYNIETGSPINDFNSEFAIKHDEFNWKISTNNRMLLTFVIDQSPIYDILTSVYQYRINKLLRMDKALCSRNRCMILPFGNKKRLFIVDIEFSNYDNKDEIINDIMNIMNSGYSKKEFDISKSQLIGNILYDICDPLRNVVMNCERLILGQCGINRLIEEIESCTYKESLSTPKKDFNYVIGVR